MLVLLYYTFCILYIVQNIDSIQFYVFISSRAASIIDNLNMNSTEYLVYVLVVLERHVMCFLNVKVTAMTSKIKVIVTIDDSVFHGL